jgi:hypothetical protein
MLVASTTTVEGWERRAWRGREGVKSMGPGIACPFEISGRGADVTNLKVSTQLGSPRACVTRFRG